MVLVGSICNVCPGKSKIHTGSWVRYKGTWYQLGQTQHRADGPYWYGPGKGKGPGPSGPDPGNGGPHSGATAV